MDSVFIGVRTVSNREITETPPVVRAKLATQAKVHSKKGEWGVESACIHDIRDGHRSVMVRFSSKIVHLNKVKNA